MACYNAQAVAFFAELHTDIAFLSSGGVSFAEGLTDFYREEVATRRMILRNARRAFVSADSNKIGRVAPFHVCDLGEVEGLITDVVPTSSILHELERLGVQLVLPEERNPAPPFEASVAASA